METVKTVRLSCDLKIIPELIRGLSQSVLTFRTVSPVGHAGLL